MWEVVLSMDDVSSCGAASISRAIHYVDGVHSVTVFKDSNRVVVEGWAYADALAATLRTEFTSQTVTVVRNGLRERRRQGFEFSSSSEEEDDEEEDDDDEDDSSSEEEEEDYPANPEDWWPRNASIEWRGTDLSARRIREPSWSDQPVADPSLSFYNFTLADNPSSSSTKEEDDDDN